MLCLCVVKLTDLCLCDCQIKDGQTPLMVAVGAGHLSVVEAFLKEPSQCCELNLREYVCDTE